MKESLKKAEDGMATLEAVFLLTFTLFILLMFLGFGFIYYQYWVVAHTANDTATRIGQNYAYCANDLVSGYVTDDMRQALSPFRYASDTLETVNEGRAVDYAIASLRKASLAIETREPYVEVKIVRDSLARRHVEVTIDAEYRLLFSYALDYFGFDGTPEYQYTAYAQIVDLQDYIQTVGTVKDITGIVDKKFPTSSVNAIIDDVKSGIDDHYSHIYQKYKCKLEKQKSAQEQ